MSFKWDFAGNYLAEQELVALNDENSFPTREAAEQWLGEIWPQLVDFGVDSVTLFDGNIQITEPMDLS